MTKCSENRKPTRGNLIAKSVMVYTDRSMNMLSYKHAIKQMQRKPKLSDTQGWENTHTNTKALEWIWSREREWSGHWAQGEVV